MSRMVQYVGSTRIIARPATRRWHQQNHTDEFNRSTEMTQDDIVKHISGPVPAQSKLLYLNYYSPPPPPSSVVVVAAAAAAAAPAPAAAGGCCCCCGQYFYISIQTYIYKYIYKYIYISIYIYICC